MGDFVLRNYSEDIMAEGVNKEFMRTLAHILLPHVYVIGPYHRDNIDDNYQDAIDLAEELYTSGICLPVIPVLTCGFWNQKYPNSTEFWNEYCFQVMKRCDAVLVFEAYESIEEIKEAERLEMPIFYGMESLEEWTENGAE
jgi:hypothetical protein